MPRTTGCIGPIAAYLMVHGASTAVLAPRYRVLFRPRIDRLGRTKDRGLMAALRLFEAQHPGWESEAQTEFMGVRAA